MYGPFKICMLNTIYIYVYTAVCAAKAHTFEVYAQKIYYSIISK